MTCPNCARVQAENDRLASILQRAVEAYERQERVRREGLALEVDRVRRTRAIEQARALLKVGDRLQVEHGCSRKIINVTFTGWQGIWICCRTYSDIFATDIRKVNGQTINFGAELLMLGDEVPF